MRLSRKKVKSILSHVHAPIATSKSPRHETQAVASKFDEVYLQVVVVFKGMVSESAEIADLELTKSVRIETTIISFVVKNSACGRNRTYAPYEHHTPRTTFGVCSWL